MLYPFFDKKLIPFSLLENTPNGLKCSILLEELKLTGAVPYYVTVPISFAKHEQKEPWFLKG